VFPSLPTNHDDCLGPCALHANDGGFRIGISVPHVSDNMTSNILFTCVMFFSCIFGLMCALKGYALMFLQVSQMRAHWLVAPLLIGLCTSCFASPTVKLPNGELGSLHDLVTSLV
jgi:cadmium resistance protein CadD (predicted permease)